MRKNINILSKMWERGLTQKALAAGAGVSPLTVSEIIKYKRSPAHKTATKIADFLECEIEDIFEVRIITVKKLI